MKKENVNHPKHYNSHPAGIECIDIIRHYTCDIANALKYLWRAGLKVPSKREQYQTRLSIAECEETRPIGQTETDKAAIEREKSDAGIGSSERELTRLKVKEDAEKEIEDLKKALWYIEDYNDNFTTYYVAKEKRIKAIIREVTDHSIEEITHGYEPNVCEAMRYLLQTGIIREGKIRQVYTWKFNLKLATHCIQDRILDIEMQLTNKELQSTVDVLNGYAVEGEDYVSKPGGVRDTEPDKYDPLNIIIVQGTAYCLSDEVHKKPNGSLYSPCDNCDLRQECLSGDGTDQMKSLCHLHFATDQQYYREVGTAKYAPSLGTIEVVDEIKEMQKTLKELEKEE